MKVTFADLRAKRESAWQTGVRTVLLKQEKKSHDAQHIHFRGATVRSWRSRFLFLFFSLEGLPSAPNKASFIQLAFADLAAKRESAWMMGVETALFGQERNIPEASTCNFHGDTAES